MNVNIFDPYTNIGWYFVAAVILMLLG